MCIDTMLIYMLTYYIILDKIDVNWSRYFNNVFEATSINPLSLIVSSD